MSLNVILLDLISYKYAQHYFRDRGPFQKIHNAFVFIGAYLYEIKPQSTT